VAQTIKDMALNAGVQDRSHQQAQQKSADNDEGTQHEGFHSDEGDLSTRPRPHREVRR